MFRKKNIQRIFVLVPKGPDTNGVNMGIDRRALRYTISFI